MKILTLALLLCVGFAAVEKDKIQKVPVHIV